jgi:DNA-directed RNA polymerase subunit RPC12/RpoP
MYYYKCDHCNGEAALLVDMPLEGELVCKDNILDSVYGQAVRCKECNKEILYYIENVRGRR